MSAMPGDAESHRGARVERLDAVFSQRSPVLLCVVIAVSVIGYGLASGATKGIWIFPDELGYGLLAQSFASSGHFALRGVETLSYPIGYPTLIAPAFVGHAPVHSYEAAKWLNAVLMSAAALPTYLIARRLVPGRFALLAAALTLLIPSMAYTGVLMSENAFFPVFMLAMLTFVRVLERPTASRQIVAILAILPVVAVRAEGVILIPLLLLAMGAYAVSAADRRPKGYARALLRELRRFQVTWLVFPVGLVGLVLAEVALGRSPTSILGRYAGSARTYALIPTLRWSLYQAVDLELYLAVIPFLAGCFVAARLLGSAETERAARAVAAVAVPAVFLSVLAAGAASAGAQGGPEDNTPYIPPELHDRYCFFVAPFFLVFFVYSLRNRQFSKRAFLVLLALASAFPLALPYTKVHANADFDALALLPWSNQLVSGRHVHYAMAVTALLLCSVAVPSRKSILAAQIAVVSVGLLIMNVVAENEISAASTRVASSRSEDRAWIDRLVPASTSVAVLWRKERAWHAATLIRREQALWRAELFNPSIRAVFYLGAPMQYDLPTERASYRDGELELPGSVRYRYILTASALPLPGTVVARDRRAGLTLYQLRTATTG